MNGGYSIAFLTQPRERLLGKLRTLTILRGRDQHCPNCEDVWVRVLCFHPTLPIVAIVESVHEKTQYIAMHSSFVSFHMVCNP
mmetsp:Transcript_10520/g.39121  ORF Transcript_10520/g.39121 Transcript_10520/m.39121 type:complete len:83 (+) Transcript_10520:813-1061(+)